MGALAASVLSMACGSAGAQADGEEPAKHGPRMELAAEPLVRFDALAPQGARIEAIGWAAGGAHAVGVSVGTRLESVAALPGQAPRVESFPSVGVRWRSTLSDRRRVDVAAWRRVDADDAAGLSTRIELQFTSPRSSVALADFGAIGMQLEGNAKLQLKIRSGKPMFYYRSKF